MSYVGHMRNNETAAPVTTYKRNRDRIAAERVRRSSAPVTTYKRNRERIATYWSDTLGRKVTIPE